jgi:hypothetical protein
MVVKLLAGTFPWKNGFAQARRSRSEKNNRKAQPNAHYFLRVNLLRRLNLATKRFIDSTRADMVQLP